MIGKAAVLDELVAMSRRLGEPDNDYAILGEGNTSAAIDQDTFFVKASGAELRTVDAAGFVEVRKPPVLAMLDGPDLSDAEIKDALAAAKVDPTSPARPSVETVLHGLLLNVPGVRFVAHTHPAAVNAILCSARAREAVSGRLFPDEIVVCGPASAFVEYVDPGLPLARAVREAVSAYLHEYGGAPKVIHMRNHGMIALGATAQEAEAITAMAVKSARVLAGTYALGGPHFLTSDHVSRIWTRPDERYRQEALRGRRPQ
jgi:rhamnose utilization protein RhaD (predicted bifunctional aldolase and dehydrogenase)